MTEKWKIIPGYYGLYEVSNKGCVRSWKNSRGNMSDRSKLLSPNENSKGYLRAELWVHNKRKREFVHRLVAKAFIPNSENKKHINHKDSNPKNNHVSNLEWCTHKENMKHSLIHGNHRVGEMCDHSVLSKSDVMEIIRLYHKEGLRIFEISKRYPVKRNQIGKIVRGKAWKHVYGEAIYEETGESFGI